MHLFYELFFNMSVKLSDQLQESDSVLISALKIPKQTNNYFIFNIAGRVWMKISSVFYLHRWLMILAQFIVGKLVVW